MSGYGHRPPCPLIPDASRPQGPAHQQRDVSLSGWLGSGLVRSGVERLGTLDVRVRPCSRAFFTWR